MIFVVMTIVVGCRMFVVMTVILLVGCGIFVAVTVTVVVCEVFVAIIIVVCCWSHSDQHEIMSYTTPSVGISSGTV